VVIKLASGIDATLGGFAGLIRRGTNPRWPRQVVGVFFPAGTLADADEVWTLRVAIELQGHTGSLTLHRSTRGEGVLPPGEHGTDALLFNASVVDPYLEQQTLRTLAAEGQDIPEIIAYLLESEVDYLVLYGISVLDRHLASDLHQKMSPHLEERLEEIAADETRSKTVQTLAADYLKRGSR